MKFKDVKVGDRVAFHRSTAFDIVKGVKYEVISVGDNGFTIIDGAGDEQYFRYSSEDYEVVGNDKSTLNLIANLAQEVAQLKRELNELREGVQAQAYEDNERIECILDDIVMLDERTHDVNNGGHKLLSKEVYIYDTE